jgi:hypothetical protein
MSRVEDIKICQRRGTIILNIREFEGVDLLNLKEITTLVSF